MDNKTVFEQIYRKKVWGEGSGSGSDPKYCKNFLLWINDYIFKQKINQVLDLGCGDGRIGDSIHVKKYMGVDVVPLGQQVVADFTNLKELDRLLAWMSGEHTLVLLKDVLQHWDDPQVQFFMDCLLNHRRITVVTVNNYKYIRQKGRPVYPRDINNRYVWAPIDFMSIPYVTYRGEHVMNYRAKQVMMWRLEC